MVYQIRNTLRYMNYQDRKSYAQQLKSIYNTTNAECAFEALETLKNDLPEFAPALRSWYSN
ncbi:transposase [Cetobacterium sp.]|uniref:transposase n=1 Tax=Cetobacterium sp. TaxID=2071632 RepID=UPI003F3260B5